MTTDTTPLAPTDAELMDLGHECELDAIEFGRAVLAKWGTPAPVGMEPFAWTDDDSTRSGATATSHRVVTNETKKSMPAAAAVSFTVPLYTAEVLAVPLTPEQRTAAFIRAEKKMQSDVNLTWRHALADEIEAAHGIKGGQHDF